MLQSRQTLEVLVLRPSNIGQGVGGFDAEAMEMTSSEDTHGFSIWALGAGTSGLHQERNLQQQAAQARGVLQAQVVRNQEEIIRHQQRKALVQQEAKRHHEQRQQMERTHLELQQQRLLATRAQLRMLQPVPPEQQRIEDEDFLRARAAEVAALGRKHKTEDDNHRKELAEHLSQQRQEEESLASRHAEQEKEQREHQLREQERLQRKQQQQHELTQLLQAQQAKRRSGPQQQQQQQLALGLAQQQQVMRQQMIRQQAEVNAWQRREQREQAVAMAQKLRKNMVQEQQQQQQKQRARAPPPLTEAMATDLLHFTMRRCPKRKTFGLAVSLPRLGSDNAAALASIAAAEADGAGPTVGREVQAVADSERTALSLLGNGTDAACMPTAAQLWRCHPSIANRSPQMRLPSALVVPHDLGRDTPAAIAGFRRGDHILSFGGIDVATLVLHSVLEQCFAENVWYAHFRSEAVRDGNLKQQVETTQKAVPASETKPSDATAAVAKRNFEMRCVLCKLQDFCHNTVHPVAFCVRKVSRRAWVTAAGRVKVLSAMVRALSTDDELALEVCRVKEGEASSASALPAPTPANASSEPTSAMAVVAPSEGKKPSNDAATSDASAAPVDTAAVLAEKRPLPSGDNDGGEAKRARSSGGN